MDLKQLTLLLQEKIEASNLGITKCISYVTPIINYVRDVRALPYIYILRTFQIMRLFEENIIFTYFYTTPPNIKIPILLAIGHTIDSIFICKKQRRASKQPLHLLS